MNDESNAPVSADAPSTLDFPVVGIGASAGGLKALLAFFAHMPSGSGMAFVVVVHLSPEHESHIDALLQGITHMRVLEVNESVHIERDHVYVIPPTQQLSMTDGMLELAPLPKPRGRHTAIDAFFRTLARTHRQRSIGIVLSGTGSDGTLGLRAIKEQGGVTLAQSPEDAEYDAMPRNAIGAGDVDFVLPVAGMPQKVLEIWQNARAIELPPLDEPVSRERAAERAETALQEVLAILHSRTGHDFTQYKRGTMLRRIERRLQVTQLRDIPTYADYLRDRPVETQALLRDMLISVTSFFRDRAVYEALEKQVVPKLFESMGVSDQVRVWVVGCATGEEAYSIAMLLAEHAETLSDPPKLQVFATDVDEEALAFARAAWYPETISADVSAERLHRFFVKERGGYCVNKALRASVMFAAHNIISDPPFSRIDLVSCRNLLIYLNRPLQGKVIDILHFALRPEGWLLLGTTESVDEASDTFLMFDKTARIFQPQPRARTGMYVQTLPSATSPRATGSLAANPPGKRQVSYGDLHQSLLEHYAPPSVVVNDQFDIVHLSDTAGRYLQFGAGDASLNLPKVVQPELRLELRAALDRAKGSMKTVELIGLTVRRGTQSATIDIKVHPVRDLGTGRTFALVIFEEVEETFRRRLPEPRTEPLDMGELEGELDRAQSQLRATVEQYEIQNEELKAGNEELQAINEELRAATEELETSKEELQSINEELTTVNEELKSKVEETTSVNNDLQNFIASTEIGVLFVDRSLRLMRFTPPVRAIFNVRPGDVGRSLLDITHRLKYDGIEKDIESVFETLRVVEREVEGEAGNWYISRMLPYRTTEDRIDGVVLTFIDITRRRQAEEGSRRSQRRLDLMMESVKDYAILTTDVHGIIDSWNAGAEKIFGWSAAEAIGKPSDMIFVPEDRTANVPQEERSHASRDGRAADERWHLRKDGTRFYVSGMMAPLLDGGIYGYVKIARDLTEQRLAASKREEMLSQERIDRAAAEEANRLKDEFLATLSHELRNPLSLILMQTELLLRSPEISKADRLHRAAEIIHQTVSTQAQLVEDLLDVSRAKTGKLSINQQLLPLPFIVADSIGALKQDAEAKDISLEVDLTSEALIVPADTVRVKQMAWNLLNNAIKFTPSGGKVIVRLKREGAEARLDVEDTGQGIAPDHLPRIFEWFRQGDASPTRRQGGMGIGLALVRHLAELQGGRVEAHSEGVGKGSRFTVWLPLHVTAQESAVPLPMVNDPHSRDGVLKDIRVLLVDDLRASAESLRDLLELDGARVDATTSGEKAIDLAARQQYDIVISDIAMPEMDGHTMLRRLRELPSGRDIPAIAYTGYGRAQDLQRSREAGFDRHFTKPLDLSRLVEAIRELAHQSRARNGDRPSAD